MMGISEDANSRPYNSCDEMVNLLSWVLEEQRKALQAFLCMSDEGSSHVWIRVNGVDLDPTEQGISDGVVIWEYECISKTKVG